MELLYFVQLFYATQWKVCNSTYILLSYIVEISRTPFRENTVCMQVVVVPPFFKEKKQFFCLQNSLNNFLLFSPLAILPPTDQCM